MISESEVPFPCGEMPTNYGNTIICTFSNEKSRSITLRLPLLSVTARLIGVVVV